MQLVSIGEDPPLNIPPPLSAELPEKVQLVSTGEEEVLYIPPPLPAELPEKVQLVSAGEESWLSIPPPLELAELPEKVQLVTTGELESVVGHPAAVGRPSCPRKCSRSTPARSICCTSPRRRQSTELP